MEPGALRAGRCALAGEDVVGVELGFGGAAAFGGGAGLAGRGDALKLAFAGVSATDLVGLIFLPVSLCQKVMRSPKRMLRGLGVCSLLPRTQTPLSNHEYSLQQRRRRALGPFSSNQQPTELGRLPQSRPLSG